MKIISLFAAVLLVLIWASDCSIKIETNFGELNSFRTLKLAPWSSMNEIRAQYNELRTKANSIEQEQLKQAYDSICTERAEYHYDDKARMSILPLLFGVLWKTFLSEAGCGILAFVFFMLNKFQNLLASPLFYVVLAFELVGKLIPYYFNSYVTQYIFSLALGMIFYCIQKLVLKVINKWRNKDKIN